MYTVNQVISFYDDLSPSDKAQVASYIQANGSASTDKTFQVTVLRKDTRRAVNIVGAIKAIRGATGGGLKEVKCMIDNLPTTLHFTNSNDAQSLSEYLEEVGFVTILGA